MKNESLDQDLPSSFLDWLEPLVQGEQIRGGKMEINQPIKGTTHLNPDEYDFPEEPNETA